MTQSLNLLDGDKPYRDPSISPEGTRDTAPLNQDIAAKTSALSVNGRTSSMQNPPKTSWRGPQSTRRAGWQ